MKWLFLLRAFIPSWRFFDETGPELKLQVRHVLASGDWSAWQEALPTITRGPRSFPLNAWGGYRHACQNSLEHLLLDLNDEQDKVAEFTSYQIVKAMAEYQLRQTAHLGNTVNFQFRILTAPVGVAAEELLISPEYRL